MHSQRKPDALFSYDGIFIYVVIWLYKKILYVLIVFWRRKILLDFTVRLHTMEYVNSNAIVLLRNAQNSRKKKHACREYLLLPKCCNRKSVFYLCVGESQVRRKLRTNACSFLWMFYLFFSTFYSLEEWRCILVRKRTRAACFYCVTL